MAFQWCAPSQPEPRQTRVNQWTRVKFHHGTKWCRRLFFLLNIIRKLLARIRTLMLLSPLIILRRGNSRILKALITLRRSNSMMRDLFSVIVTLPYRYTPPQQDPGYLSGVAAALANNYRILRDNLIRLRLWIRTRFSSSKGLIIPPVEGHCL